MASSSPWTLPISNYLTLNRPSQTSISGIPMLAVAPSPTKSVGYSMNQSQAPQTTGSQQASASSPLASPASNRNRANSPPATPPPQHSASASPIPQQSRPASPQSQHWPANHLSMRSRPSSVAAMSPPLGASALGSGANTNMAAQLSPTAPPQGSMGSTTTSTTSLKPRAFSQSSQSQSATPMSLPNPFAMQLPLLSYFSGSSGAPTQWSTAWSTPASTTSQSWMSGLRMSLPRPAMSSPVGGPPAPFTLQLPLLSNLSGAAHQSSSTSTTSNRHVSQSTAAPPHQRSMSSSTTTSTSSATASSALRPPQVSLYKFIVPDHLSLLSYFNEYINITQCLYTSMYEYSEAAR